ncbi:hypothetical protein ACE6H2_001689 [Prunus campanulata]
MEKRKEDHNIPYILQLPNNILAEIFRKTPIKTLVQSRFVCKCWHRSHPQFNEQLFWQTTCLLLRPSIQLVTLENDSTSPYGFALKLSEDRILRRTDDRLHIVGSCNGLLCLYKFDSWKPPCGRLYISNPITGESLALPTPPDESIRFNGLWGVAGEHSGSLHACSFGGNIKEEENKKPSLRVTLL